MSKRRNRPAARVSQHMETVESDALAVAEFLK
jgi:hypothetical protein